MKLATTLALAFLLLISAVPTFALDGYSREAAEEVSSRLFQALVGRDAATGEAAAVIAELQRGRSLSALGIVMANPSAQQLLSVSSSAENLERAFEGLLHRAPDSGAVKGYLPMVEAGKISEVIGSILQSDEFSRSVDATVAEADDGEEAEEEVAEEVDLVTPCQEAVLARTISDRDGKEVKLSFKGYEAKIYPMDEGKVHVRGTAKIGSGSNAKEIPYECTVREKNGKVVSASYAQ